MKALIIANGELYKSEALRHRIRAEAFDLVMAADGGERYAAKLDINLDVVIGDMDSISNSKQYDTSTTKIISCPIEKDETDLEIALLYAKEQGIKKIVLVGVLGGRMDMTIANLLLITHPCLNLHRIEIWHGEQTGWLIRPPGEEICGSIGDTISLVPMSSQVSAISTRGLKYRLENEDFEFGPTRGVSNIMVQTKAHITLSSGLLLVIHTPNIT
ncbi:MAG: thiamine diphosphokinase [Dehalococcoidia bacterium]|nr:MAG: thiamine diphosphokinase [Dehalococcoidia bacterium]